LLRASAPRRAPQVESPIILRRRSLQSGRGRYAGDVELAASHGYKFWIPIRRRRGALVCVGRALVLRRSCWSRPGSHEEFLNVPAGIEARQSGEVVKLILARGVLLPAVFFKIPVSSGLFELLDMEAGESCSVAGQQREQGTVQRQRLRIDCALRLAEINNHRGRCDDQRKPAESKLAHKSSFAPRRAAGRRENAA